MDHDYSADCIEHLSFALALSKPFAQAIDAPQHFVSMSQYRMVAISNYAPLCESVGKWAEFQ